MAFEGNLILTRSCAMPKLCLVDATLYICQEISKINNKSTFSRITEINSKSECSRITKINSKSEALRITKINSKSESSRITRHERLKYMLLKRTCNLHRFLQVTGKAGGMTKCLSLLYTQMFLLSFVSPLIMQCIIEENK